MTRSYIINARQSCPIVSIHSFICTYINHGIPSRPIDAVQHLYLTYTVIVRVSALAADAISGTFITKPIKFISGHNCISVANISAETYAALIAYNNGIAIQKSARKVTITTSSRPTKHFGKKSWRNKLFPNFELGRDGTSV